MMLLIPTKTKLLIIALFVGVIIMFTIFLALSSTKQTQPSAPPADVPIVIPNSNVQSEPTFKNYLTIKLNDSSEGLDKLSGFIKKTDLSSQKIKYEFSSTYPGISNNIVSGNQKVIFKSNVVISSDNYKTPFIETYLQNYGSPEVEFTGSEKYGRFAKTYIYPSQGFALIFNPATKEVYELQSFNPASLEEYIRDWGWDLKDYSKESPRPEI